MPEKLVKRIRAIRSESSEEIIKKYSNPEELARIAYNLYIVDGIELSKERLVELANKE